MAKAKNRSDDSKLGRREREHSIGWGDGNEGGIEKEARSTGIRRARVDYKLGFVAHLAPKLTQGTYAKKNMV